MFINPTPYVFCHGSGPVFNSDDHKSVPQLYYNSRPGQFPVLRSQSQLQLQHRRRKAPLSETSQVARRRAMMEEDPWIESISDFEEGPLFHSPFLNNGGPSHRQPKHEAVHASEHDLDLEDTEMAEHCRQECNSQLDMSRQQFQNLEPTAWQHNPPGVFPPELHDPYQSNHPGWSFATSSPSFLQQPMSASTHMNACTPGSSSLAGHMPPSAPAGHFGNPTSAIIPDGLPRDHSSLFNFQNNSSELQQHHLYGSNAAAFHQQSLACQQRWSPDSLNRGVPPHQIYQALPPSPLTSMMSHEDMSSAVSKVAPHNSNGRSDLEYPQGSMHSFQGDASSAPFDVTEYAPKQDQDSRLRTRLPSGAPSNGPSSSLSPAQQPSTLNGYYGVASQGVRSPSLSNSSSTAIGQSGHLASSSSKHHRSPSAPPVEVRCAKDEYLVQSRQSGMTYKDIKAEGKFAEAESTLRGRYRMLTKKKEARVRRPEWSEKDVYLLESAVKKACKGKDPATVKLPWKQIAKYIDENGGTYLFGNATCRKKWDELRAEDLEE